MKNILNKKIFAPKKVPFGLDLSDLSVKMVELEEYGNGTMGVRAYAATDIPGGSIADGEIINEDNVVNAVRSAITSAQPKSLRSREVFCSLPETKSFLRVIDIPIMKSEEAAEAIKWELEENIPMSIDQVCYDWRPLQENLKNKKDHQSVLIVAVARSVVDGFLQVVEKSGLEPVGMEVESIAQARSLLPEEASKDTILIIDIGDRRTSLLFSVNGTIIFTSSMHTSSQMMTDAIAKNFGLSQEKAEKMKIDKGIGQFIHQDPVFQAVSPVLENLVEQISNSIDFFKTGMKYSDHIDKIVLCGGGANTKGLVPYLTRKLEVSVEKGNPWTNVKLGRQLPPIPKEQALQFSTAIGLASQGLHFQYEDIS